MVYILQTSCLISIFKVTKAACVYQFIFHFALHTTRDIIYPRKIKLLNSSNDASEGFGALPTIDVFIIPLHSVICLIHTIMRIKNDKW